MELDLACGIDQDESATCIAYQSLRLWKCVPMVPFPLSLDQHPFVGGWATTSKQQLLWGKNGADFDGMILLISGNRDIRDQNIEIT